MSIKNPQGEFWVKVCWFYTKIVHFATGYSLRSEHKVAVMAPDSKNRIGIALIWVVVSCKSSSYVFVGFSVAGGETIESFMWGGVTLFSPDTFLCDQGYLSRNCRFRDHGNSRSCTRGR